MMAYKVVEHFINNTEFSFETKEDFMQMAFFRNGDWTNTWKTFVSIEAKSFCTEDELDRLGDLLDIYDSIVTTEWNAETQTYSQIEVWNTQDDYTFFKNIINKVYAFYKEEQSLFFTRSIFSQEEI